MFHVTCCAGMIQSPKACGIFHIAPYFAVSLSLVLLLVNLILFDSTPNIQDYHYFIKNRRKHLLGKSTLNPFVNVENGLHRITELSEKTLTSTIKLNSLKIFIYDLPTQFNYDLIRETKFYLSKFDNDGSTCNTQITLHEFLLTSNYRVYNPAKADFFYVPVYGSCHYPHMDGSLKIYNEALIYIKTHYPYFNTSYGRDHVWVSGIMSGMKKSTTWHLETKNCLFLFCGIHSIRDVDYIPYKDMIIAPDFGSYNFTPFYEHPSSIRPKRKYLVHIAGCTYGAPHTTKTHANGTRVTSYFRHLFSPSKVKVSSFKSKSLLHDMMSSVFCLCPTGTHGWSRMYYLSILMGCIPVLFDTENEVAFQDIVDPSKFTVQVRIQDIDYLKELLTSISSGHILSMQSELERIWQLFYYGSSGLAKEAIVKSLVRKKTTNHVHYRYNSIHP